MSKHTKKDNPVTYDKQLRKWSTTFYNGHMRYISIIISYQISLECLLKDRCSKSLEIMLLFFAIMKSNHNYKTLVYQINTG